jgi:hypothetical protein
MNTLLEYITNPLSLVLIVFIFFLLTFNILQRLGRGRAWKQIAAETGLQLSKHRTATYKDQQLSGIYRKRSLTLTESESEEYRADRRRGSQESNSANTDTEIRLKTNIPKSIKMGVHRVIAIGEAAQVTGDSEIDRRFNITSEPGRLAQKVLASSSIRPQLLHLKMGGRIIIQEADLIFSQPGRISDGKYLRFLFVFLSDLADAVEAAANNVS